MILFIHFQSGYFSSMFSGSWKETTLSTIHMDIPDENIDEDGEITLFKFIVENNNFQYLK